MNPGSGLWGGVQSQRWGASSLHLRIKVRRARGLGIQLSVGYPIWNADTGCTILIGPESIHAARNSWLAIEAQVAECIWGSLRPASSPFLITRTWDGGDPKQKSLFSESPLFPLETGHSSEPDMKSVKFYFFLAQGHVGASPCSKRLFF